MYTIIYQSQIEINKNLPSRFPVDTIFYFESGNNSKLDNWVAEHIDDLRNTVKAIGDENVPMLFPLNFQCISHTSSEKKEDETQNDWGLRALLQVRNIGNTGYLYEAKTTDLSPIEFVNILIVFARELHRINRDILIGLPLDHVLDDSVQEIIDTIHLEQWEDYINSQAAEYWADEEKSFIEKTWASLGLTTIPKFKGEMPSYIPFDLEGFNDPSFKKLLADISRLPKIAPEEVNDWVAKARTGNKEARDAILCEYLSYSISLISRIKSKILTPADLMITCIEGISSAIDTFDPTRGAAFQTWSVWKMKEELTQELRHLDVEFKEYKETKHESEDIEKEWGSSNEPIKNQIIYDTDFDQFVSATYSTFNTNLSEYINNLLDTCLTPAEKEVVLCESGIKEGSRSYLCETLNRKSSSITMIKQRALEKLRNNPKIMEALLEAIG